MSLRSRHSAVAATPARSTPGRSAVSATQRGAVNELPPYQPLQHPLSTASRDRLRVLAQPFKFEQDHSLLAEVISCLSDAAAETNDALSDKERALKNAQQKAKNNDGADQERVEEMERQYQELQAKVDNMTQQLDKDVRRMIDADNNIAEMQRTLQALAADVSNASTQRTQRTQRLDDDDEEYPDFDPTDPTNATQRPLAVTNLFSERLSRAKDSYTNQSNTDRYSRNNLYVGFKGVVHDARWANTDKVLPPAHLWFKDGRAEPGLTANNAEDSDDDLQIAKETISTKCPLTLQEFRDPVTSRKCPHSFEREAIVSMIDMQTNMARVAGAKAVQCPVAGCQNMLTTADLHSDPVLKRKIARIQRAERDAEESDDENDNRPHSIASDDDAMDVDETPAKRFKKERVSGTTPAPTQNQRRRGQQTVVSLDEDEEEDE